MEVSSSLSIYKSFLLIISIVLLSNSFAESHGNFSLVDKLTRDAFPRDFLFGVGTSAMQVEGQALGKRGPSIWDYIVQHSNGTIRDADKYPRMIEHYNRYKSDVLILKNLGINSYRFSISWSRILPDGTLKGGINQEGIDFYNKLIDLLIENDITPFVTILHFDYPLGFFNSGAFLNHSIVDAFKDYSELLFKTYGDRVKHWITVNEAEVSAFFSYMIGFENPQPHEHCQKSKECKQAYALIHNYVLSHATAAKLYRDKFKAEQGGEIGIVVSGEEYVPYSSKPEDVAAADRLGDFFYGWLLNPLVHGDYAETMKKQVKDRLPVFTEEEKKLIKGSVDFIGLNYYRSYYARAQLNKSLINGFENFDSLTIREALNAEGKPLGYLDQPTKSFVYPKGLFDLLMRMKQKYQNPKIYITENGIISGDLQNPLNDKHRQDYHAAHIKAMKSAIEAGVNVRGYFIWAAFDTFEFGNGFTQKTGLISIDFNNNLKRTPKSSAIWYKMFLSDMKAI